MFEIVIRLKNKETMIYSGLTKDQADAVFLKYQSEKGIAHVEFNECNDPYAITY